MAPIIQHADELSARELPRNLVFPDESKTYAIKRGANNDLHVVDDQRPVDRDGQGFSALFELPPVNLAAMPVTKIDAWETDQVTRSLRFRV